MLGGNKLMNKFLRVLGLGLMIATFAFAGFAQTEEKTKLYNTYIEKYQSDKVADLQIALDAAKQYIAKFNTEEDKQQVDYFKEAIPTLEKAIEDKKNQELVNAEKKQWNDLLGRVNTAVQGKNWQQTFTVGKEALDRQLKYVDANSVKQTKLDLAIVLALIGFDRAVEKNDTFNNEAITYAKQAIQQIEAGQTSQKFGEFGTYQLNNKDNALGLLNYYIGYILNYRQNKPEEAIPYLYKATQYNSASNKIPAVYQLIGQKFYNQLIEMGKKRKAKTEALEKAETEEAKEALANEIKAIYAEEKGVADRGIEAYAKAIKAAQQPDQKLSQEYKDGLRASFEDLYKFRFNNKTDGIDAHINMVASKPLTNPSAPIQPVVEEETQATNTVSTPPSTTPSTKPATTNGTKTTAPANNGTKTVKTSTTDNKTTTPAKKPRKRR